MGLPSPTLISRPKNVVGTPRSTVEALNRGDIVLPFVNGIDHGQEGSRAYAGQENYDVDFAAENPCGKEERFLVGFERNFAHCGGGGGGTRE